MRDSIARKALEISGALTLPLLAVIWIVAPQPVVRILAVVLAAAAILGMWLLARSVSYRVRQLTAFVDGMLDRGERPRLATGDDELGELARSLSRMAPRLEELVSRLSMELMRREAVLATMTEGVVAVDAQLNLTFCNRSFMRTVGDHGMPEGVPLVRVSRDPALLRMLKEVIDSGKTLNQRLQLPGPDGRFFEVYAAPLANSTSRGALAILHDVTPQEHLERIKRDFIANVSHEFRTPLATIRGYAETLLDGGLEDRKNRRQFVEIIQANAVRLNNIAADLLVLSELESGRPEPGPIQLGEAVNSAVRAVETAARLKGLALRVGGIPDVQVRGYGLRFEQALLNLLDNAVKFNRDNGEVRVDVQAANGRVEIAVSDTGIGIPAEDLSRIFERFYRVDKARSRSVGGTGLGLAIVKHAIEQMNGAVSVESQLGKGSKFIISLPKFAPR